MKVCVVAEVEGIDLAVVGDSPAPGDVGYHVHVLVEPHEAAEERIEGPDDRAGVQSGVEGIRLLTQQDEYVVGRGLRRVGRQERERSDYLIEGIAQTVEVGGRSVCSKYKVLSAAQYARPALLDAELALPLEHCAIAGGGRTQRDGKLLVDVDEAFTIVGDLPIHPFAWGVGPDVAVDGYLNGYEVGISRRFELDDRDPTPRFADTPVGGRRDGEAHQVVGVGLGIVRGRHVRR